MAEEQITYGNWLQPKSAGIWGLGLVGTAVMFGGLLVILLTVMFSQNLLAGFIEAIFLLAFIVVFTVKFTGRTLLVRIMDNRSFAARARRGETLYVTGSVSALPRESARSLPGVLGTTKTLTGMDGLGNEFAAIHYPSRDLFAVSLRCQPDGIGMVDRDMTDSQVALYGAWLAALPNEDGLVGATVTVETAPGTGTHLIETLLAQRVATAPVIASEIMDSAMKMLPVSSDEVVAYVTLVWRGTGALHQNSDPEDVLAELAKRLPSQIHSLTAAGAGDPTPMTETDLALVARVAYDPATAESIEQLRGQGIPIEAKWSQAGPSFFDEHRDYLLHENSASFSYEMMEPPRGLVVDTHLQRLLGPSRSFSRKRVTLFYRPIDHGSGMSVAERASKAAGFHANKQKGRISADTKRQVALSEKTESEIANGASLVPFSLMVTVTFAADEHAARVARNAMKALMSATRMNARSLTGVQAAAFHTTLPFGLLPWEFATTPAWVRSQL